MFITHCWTKDRRGKRSRWFKTNAQNSNSTTSNPSHNETFWTFFLLLLLSNNLHICSLTPGGLRLTCRWLHLLRFGVLCKQISVTSPMQQTWTVFDEFVLKKIKTINNHIHNKRANKHQLVVFVFIEEKKQIIEFCKFKFRQKTNKKKTKTEKEKLKVNPFNFLICC